MKPAGPGLAFLAAAHYYRAMLRAGSLAEMGMTFRGNKSALPVKVCAACGRPMVWRRKWRTAWEDVKYCSDACRRKAKSA